MLASSDIIAFVPAADLERARSFYRDKLGLLLVDEENGQAIVFDVNGTALRVSRVDEVPAVQHTVLGWRVADIDALVAKLRGNGIDFERFEGFSQDAQGIWTAPGGTRVAWFRDPDGNLLSLTEFAGQPG